DVAAVCAVYPRGGPTATTCAGTADGGSPDAGTSTGGGGCGCGQSEGGDLGLLAALGLIALGLGRGAGRFGRARAP
ncbi:MAG: WD40/YVTN/BNR-like repeat-containing protein, partial [Deltaproteobacteria bacterium]